ncbi:MAG: HEAT repeat domain-containing protein [Sandaracinaceae bacterium]|nr:HEAT repeat domain-containing protein [Sandaracinaceae bacterium]
MKNIEQEWHTLFRGELSSREFKSRIQRLAQFFLNQGHSRAYASICMYFGDIESAVESSVNPTDRGWSYLLDKKYLEAALAFEQAGWLAHAAFCLSQAKRWDRASFFWELLTSKPQVQSNPYVAGLVHYNNALAANALGDQKSSRKALVKALHCLAAAADAFESIGQRERAFDCYLVLIAIGRNGRFENLSEGYANAIRILREDGLKQYALQYYEDFASLAEARGELLAASAIYREAASFVQRSGLPHAENYLLRSATLSARYAENLTTSSKYPELAESTYLAAAEELVSIGNLKSAQKIYEKLTELPLPSERRLRYRRVAQRLEGAIDNHPKSSASLPPRPRNHDAYPEVWLDDLLEWEQGGEPAEAMGFLLAQSEMPEHVRRNALLARLAQLQLYPSESPNWTLVAERLGSLEIYQALAPLEHLYEHPSVAVRVAVLRALSRMFFKRSFVTVARAIHDPAIEVRKEAVACVQSLSFPHALDPLVRLFRNNQDLAVRRAALDAIARIQRLEAVEFLIQAFVSAMPSERGHVRERLRRAIQVNPEGLRLIQEEAMRARGSLRSEFEALLHMLQRQ